MQVPATKQANEKIPIPCEHCRGTGIIRGIECRECLGRGHRVVVAGRGWCRRHANNADITGRR